jgi:predicted transcriptional regulator
LAGAATQNKEQHMSLLESAVELVTAQVQYENITTAEEVLPLLQTIHQTLLDLVHPTEAELPVVDWKSSISLDHVVCMVCGESFRQLTGNHMKTHGITMADYRRRFNIPPQVPLSSKRTTRRRRQIVKETRPWVAATRANTGRRRAK